MKAKPCKQDPLVAAVIEKLPAPGQPFSPEARADWLDMMTKAFNVAYGRVEANPVAAAMPASVKPNGNGHAVPQIEHAKAGCDYYVDHDGYARCDTEMRAGLPHPTPGRRVHAEEVGAEDQIYEYRRGTLRDRETVVWADNSLGAGPGMQFCGPG